MKRTLERLARTQLRGASHRERRSLSVPWLQNSLAWAGRHRVQRQTAALDRRVHRARVRAAIALGLFTRCTAFVASGTMAVAYFSFTSGNLQTSIGCRS